MPASPPSECRRPPEGGLLVGGAEGTRTPDPLHAMQMRYQLRHSPNVASPQCGMTTRGILANRRPRCEIGVVTERPSGCTPRSRSGRRRRRWSSSTQPQLARPCSAARSATGQPSSTGTASRIAAPCETATASSPRPIGGEQLVQRRDHPGRDLVGRLAAGDDVEVAGRNRANSLGRRARRTRRGSGPASRRGSTHAAGRRTSARGRSPWRRTPPSAGPGRCRRTTARPGCRAARRAATAAAWAWPVSSSSTSSWPWIRPARVPGGLPVPEQDQAAAAQRSCETTSAGSSIAGQSRHSRSRA